MGKAQSKATANAALSRFEEKFKKSFGDVLTRSDVITPYEIISTGSLELDYKLGVGGFVEGRLVEIWGPDAVGKTTLALLALVEAQKKHPDKVVGWIDMEQKFDKQWAKDHGVDMGRLYLVVTDNAEEVADQIKEMVQSGLFSMVVLDSIGSMIPKAEVEKDADESAMGKHAGIVTRMVKISAVEARKSGCVVVYINQVRANLGYGADTTTGGGFALKHATTHKLKLKRTGKLPYSIGTGTDKNEVGHEVAIVIERNGVAPPKKVANISLMNQTTAKFGPIGVDRASEAASLGIRTKVIEKGGAWYTLPSGEKFNGEDKVIEALRAQPAMIDEIRAKALATISEKVYDEEADLEDEEVVEGGSTAFVTSGSRDD